MERLWFFLGERRPTRWAEVQADAGRWRTRAALPPPGPPGGLGLPRSRLVPGSKDELQEGWEALDVAGLQAQLLYLQRTWE